MVTGMMRDAANPTPCALASLNVIWYGLSTTMPEISLYLRGGFFG